MRQYSRPPKPGVQLFRTIALERGRIDPAARTVELSFASEEPVERYWGIEVLDCSPGSCDLSNLNDGGPLLVEHDKRDQVGVIEEAWLDKKRRRPKAIVRFGNSERATEIFNDVVEGIRQKVSVTYMIDGVEKEGDDGDKPIYRIRNWTPLEISIVAIPADATVGVGRADGSPSSLQTMNPSHIPSTNPNPSDGLPRAGSRSIGPNPRETIADILDLYHQHRCAEIDKDGAVLRHLIADPASRLEDMQNWILQNRYKARPLSLDPNIGLSDGEIKQYSLVRALRCLAERRPLDGLEDEASRAVAQRIRRAPEGFFVPHDVACRSLVNSRELSKDDMIRMLAGAQSRGLTAGIATAGGYTVGTTVLGSSLIELLRNAALVSQLGATTLSGLVGDAAIPRHTGGATGYWLDEVSAVTLSQQSFGQLALTPHRLAAATAYSKQLLQQTSLDIEAFVRADLMKVLGIEKDRACLNGLNAAGEPLGILNTTGVGSVTFGAAATRAKCLAFQTAVANANARVSAGAYLTTPAVAAVWLAKDQATNGGVWLWDGAMDKGMVCGRPAFSTKQIPSDRVIFADWADFLIADWDGFDVVVDPYTLADQHQVRVVVHLLTDCGIRHVGSFAISSDSGAQ